eukprot:jgi/Botrbrau1/22346/Bobra.0002s0024.1
MSTWHVQLSTFQLQLSLPGPYIGCRTIQTDHFCQGDAPSHATGNSHEITFQPEICHDRDCPGSKNKKVALEIHTNSTSREFPMPRDIRLDSSLRSSVKPLLLVNCIKAG